MPKIIEQNESHDWFAEAAEALVRYYFSRAGYLVFGASKWGADCVIQDKRTGKALTIEVKSTDKKSSLRRVLREKLKRIKSKGAKPDIFASVRLVERKNQEGGKIVLKLWVIDKKRNCPRDDSAISCLDPQKIRCWVKSNF